MPQCTSIYSAVVPYAVVGLHRRVSAVDVLYACGCIFVVYYLCGVFCEGGGRFSHYLLYYVGAVVCLLLASSLLLLFCLQLCMFILSVKIGMKFLE